MNNNQNVVGPFIYEDEKYHAVYYDIFTKKGFAIPKSEFQNYRFFFTLFMVSIISPFLLVELFNIEIYQAVIIGIVLFIGIEIIFKFKYIYKLNEVKNYQKPKRKSISDSFASTMSNMTLYFTTALAFLTSILLIVYVVSEGYSGINLICLCVFALVMAFMGVEGIIAIIKKNKAKK